MVHVYIFFNLKNHENLEQLNICTSVDSSPSSDTYNFIPE